MNYLNTIHWSKIRDIIIDRDKSTCTCCKKILANDKHIHHLTYKRVGKEKLNDLVLLCKECHEIKHQEKKLKKNPVVVKNSRKYAIEIELLLEGLSEYKMELILYKVKDEIERLKRFN
jgi:hypothetical protein